MSTRKLVDREEPPAEARTSGRRKRPVSELYIAAVEDAYRNFHGEWVRVRRDHPTIKNARSTASCMKRGFLRVEPANDEPAIEVAGKEGVIRTWLKLPYTIKDARAGELDGKFYVWIVVI